MQKILEHAKLNSLKHGPEPAAKHAVAIEVNIGKID